MQTQTFLQPHEAAIVAQAAEILATYNKRRDCVSSPADVKDMFRMRIGAMDREVFEVAFLDAQNRVIEVEQLFAGTLSQTPVYPREIVRRALALNAAAVIFAHNHLSGSVEPSRADERLTETCKAALAVVDVRVLDHVVVSAAETVSFAERGLI